MEEEISELADAVEYYVKTGITKKQGKWVDYRILDT